MVLGKSKDFYFFSGLPGRATSHLCGVGNIGLIGFAGFNQIVLKSITTKLILMRKLPLFP